MSGIEWCDTVESDTTADTVLSTSTCHLLDNTLGATSAFVKDGNFGNKHLEVAVTTLEGVMLSAHQRGVGQVAERTGKIKLQVLGSLAVAKIRCAVATSITFTLIVLTSIIWALATSALSIVRFIDVQISETSFNTTETIV